MLGFVVLEKLIKIISHSGNYLRVVIRVIVFPDPGGPQIKNALCSDIQLPRIN